MRPWEPFEVLAALVVLALLALVLLMGCAAPPRERITVYGVEEGGQLTVTTPVQSSTLSQPLHTAAIGRSGSIVLGQITDALLQERYGAVLATHPEPGVTYTFLFPTGKVSLNAQGRETLAELLKEIQRRGGTVEVQVEGHTDDVGQAAANDRLSMARAEAVRLLLWQGGLTATFVRVVGRGARSPLVHTPGHENAANRRVEVLVR